VLQNTFCHIRGIGPRIERHLWRWGVGSWEAARGELPLPAHKAEPVKRGAEWATVPDTHKSCLVLTLNASRGQNGANVGPSGHCASLDGKA
jgi:hypothetical protein